MRVIRDHIAAADLRPRDYIHDTIAPGRVRSVHRTLFGGVRVVVRHESGTDIVASHPPTRKLDVSRTVGARRRHLTLVWSTVEPHRVPRHHAHGP